MGDGQLTRELFDAGALRSLENSLAQPMPLMESYMGVVESVVKSRMALWDDEPGARALFDKGVELGRARFLGGDLGAPELEALRKLRDEGLLDRVIYLMDLGELEALRALAEGVRSVSGVLDPSARDAVLDPLLEDFDLETNHKYDKDYDPTPWCNQCGARTEAACDCGPIADND